MQRKLFFWLFFIFIFSSKESNVTTKRKRLLKNFQNHTNTQTQNSSQNEINSFVPFTTENLHGSNTKTPESSVSFNLLKKEDDKYFYFHSNLLNQTDKISFDFLKRREGRRYTIPSDLLNKLLENSNVFRFIFSYLSLFELELNFKYTSKTFYHLYEKILQEEKILLQSYLINEKLFLENINYTRQYFDFF